MALLEFSRDYLTSTSSQSKPVPKGIRPLVVLGVRCMLGAKAGPSAGRPALDSEVTADSTDHRQRRLVKRGFAEATFYFCTSTVC